MSELLLDCLFHVILIMATLQFIFSNISLGIYAIIVFISTIIFGIIGGINKRNEDLDNIIVNYIWRDNEF